MTNEELKTLEEQITTAKAEASVARTAAAAAEKAETAGSLDAGEAFDLFRATVAASSACRVLERRVRELEAERAKGGSR